MSVIQELYLCVGIFAVIILAIQLILIFFGPEKKETHDKNATPFALRSATAYISIFGFSAFVFTFYTLDVLAFFGGILIAYVASLLVLIIFKQDFMDAFEEYSRKKREQQNFPKQITVDEVLKKQITMDEVLKEQQEEKVETIVVKELTCTSEMAPIITEEPVKPLVVKEEKIKEEVVIVIKEEPSEPKPEIKEEPKQIIVEKAIEIEIPKIIVTAEKAEKVIEEKPKEIITEPKKEEVVKTTTVTKKTTVKKEEKIIEEEPLTEEEQEIQDLLRRLKGEKATR